MTRTVSVGALESAGRIALAALFGLLASAGSVEAQINEEKLCLTNEEGRVQAGDPILCDFRLQYGATNGDIIRIEDAPPAIPGPGEPTLTYSVQDTWSPPDTTFDLRRQVLEDTDVVRGIAPPQVPSNALPPFGPNAINGDATCTVAEGFASCDRVTGEGCTTPCILCPGRGILSQGGDGIDNTKPGGPPASGLTCPSVSDPDDPELNTAGTIFFRTNFVASCTEEGATNEVEDFAIVFNRPSCEPGVTNCDPDDNNYDDGGRTVEIECPGGGNAYKCYQIKPEPRTRFERRELQITDQFGTRDTVVVRPSQICNPVDKGQEGIVDPDAHLTCYKAVARRRDPWRTVFDLDQFTPVEEDAFVPEPLLVGRGAEVCFPALKDCVEDEDSTCVLGEIERRLNHFQCYQAKSLAEEPLVPGLLSLVDQFGATTSDVGSAIRHCNPLTNKVLDGRSEELSVATFPPPPEENQAFWEEGDEVHLKCYGLEDDTAPTRRSVTVEDQLYPEGLRVRVGRATQLCERAAKRLPEEP